MPIHSTPPRMLRREDVLRERERLWQQRTDDDALTRYGDCIAGKPNPRLGDNPLGSFLWRYGWRRAGWWIRPRLSSVVFRPYLTARKDLSREEGGVYDHDFTRGTIILIWGSSYGVPARRTVLPFLGRSGVHYREIISEEDRRANQ